MRGVRLTGIAALILTIATGCQKLNYEQSFQLTMGEVREVEFTAPTFSQKVTAVITPSKGPVSAYLAKKENGEAIRKVLDRVGQEPDASQVLASKKASEKAEPITLEATVPGKTPYILLLRAGKASTDVRVSLKGR